MAHRNARLTPHGRLLLCARVECDGWKLREAAAAAGVSRQTAGKWLARWRAEGAAGLLDRSSRPLHIALRVVGALLRKVVLLRLRKRRGPAWIAWRTQLAPATVYRALRRHRLQRLRHLEPHEPVVRYCWPHAGDLLHLDTKKSGPHRHRRRQAPRRLQGAKTTTTASAGTTRTWPSTTPRGWPTPRSSRRARRDDGRLPAARSGLLRRPGHLRCTAYSPTTAAPIARDAFRSGCRGTRPRHWRTRPYRPQTNGKAEAFVKIVQNGWAYKRPYTRPRNGSPPCQRFLRYYNGYRPHGGLDGDTPLGRLTGSITS